MMLRTGCVLAFLGVVSAMPGCGSDDSGGGGKGGGTGGKASGGTGGKASGGTGGSSGGSGGASGGTTGGSGGSAGGSSGGSAGTASGGASGSTGTGGSGGSVSGPGIVCGTTSCALPGNFCCDHPNQAPECVANGGTCTFGVEVACDGPEDCASGQVCCASLFIQGQNASYVSTTCMPSCTGKNARVVCGASGTCPSGTTCGTSDLLPPYDDCK